jgi:voltage-dependent potassium channel beta subunit
MNYRRLGDAGVKLSEIGLGGWLTFGNTIDMDRGRAIMDAAFDCGINFFDTANAYAIGKCEEYWGDLLKGRPRSSYVLATKVYFPMGKGPNDQGLSRKHITEQCHASLRRLQTDYLDLYQCHRFDENTPLEETVRAMDDLIRQGKVLYWGFSEWSVEQIEKCLQICGDRYDAPKSSQPNYSLLHRAIEEKVMPLCGRAGIGQVVFCPLAQGVLTGKYKPGSALPPDSRANDDRQNMFIKKMVENRGTLEKVQRLEPIAREHKCTMAQLSLAWILQKSEVTSCIIGATKPQQVEENAKASGMKLDEETIRRMEEIVA